MTSDGLMVGTPAYMAPEQVRGDEVDGRTDLYAVGVVFYRMLTGKLPFTADTAVAMIQSQLNVEPTPARAVRPDLPDWIDVVLARALAKHPEDRYQSADEFRRAFDGLARTPDDVLTVATSSPASDSLASLASAATPVSHGTTTLVLNRSHLAVAAALGLVMAVGVGVLAWLSLRRPGAGLAQAQPAPSGQVSANPVAAGPATSIAPRLTMAVATPGAVNVVAQTAALLMKSEAPSAEVARAAPADADIPIGLRGFGPGRPGGEAASPRAPDGGFSPLVVRDTQAILSTEGRGSRMVDAILAFSERSITATDNGTGLTVKSFPYAAVKRSTFSRSRNPRGAGGVDVPVPGGTPQGNVFSRGPRLWVTIETADDRLVLRLDPTALRPVLDALHERTKPPLERIEDPEKP
jgi:hypothetical protein